LLSHNAYYALRFAPYYINPWLFCITSITSPGYARIAETLNPAHDSGILWNLHQKKCDYMIIYQLEAQYLLMLLDQGHRKAENREPITEN